MRGRVIVVVGAVGGVGASTLAALLARSSATGGANVALVDGDPGRGGIEVLLGIEGQPGARWADLDGVRAAIDAVDLAGALPRWRGVDVLSADRRAGEIDPLATTAVMESLVAARAVVVLDLPARAVVPPTATPLWWNSGGPVSDVARRGDVVIVTGQDVLGVTGALVAAPAVVGPRTHLVLRRRRRARVAPVEAARVLGLPLLGLLPTDRRLTDAVDAGFGPVLHSWSPLARAVRHVGRGLAGG